MHAQAEGAGGSGGLGRDGPRALPFVAHDRSETYRAGIACRTLQVKKGLGRFAITMDLPHAIEAPMVARMRSSPFRVRRKGGASPATTQFWCNRVKLGRPGLARPGPSPTAREGRRESGAAPSERTP